jgi:Ca2+-transporting ATPase
METTPAENTRLNYYRLESSEVLRQLDTRSEGLTDAEAKERFERAGPNKLTLANRESPLIKFMRQFKDPMIILLLASSALSAYLGDMRTALVLSALVLFNTTIGFFQEFKAEKVMESLEKLVVAEATVRRGGQTKEVSAAELVIGDIVYIEEGNSVPADIRILEDTELATNDFALTGESNPTRKFTHAMSGEVSLAERHNMAYMGTTVAIGNGYGIVVGTGMFTELGRIASLSQVTHTEPSPLQKEMSNIAKRVTQGTIVLCAILLPIATRGGLGFKEAVLFAIGIASSIIPQGLPAEINTALARAAGLLARDRALVKKLSAVETLGATSVICTDKTGTLTKNQMTVEQMLIGKAVYKATGTGYETNGTITDKKDQHLGMVDMHKLERFFQTGAFASNAHIDPPDNEHATWYCVGDPTEGALITLTRKAGIDPDAIRDQYEEVHEFSFDSARKRMSSVRRIDGQLIAFVKGAPESVLERSSMFEDNLKSRKLTHTDRKFLLDYNEEMAHQAKRNLGFAYRILPKNTDIKNFKLDDVEHDLTFLGIVSMIDPLREEVPAAMLAARQAHIKVSIVTGDFPTTAKAIATKAGLADRPEDITVVLGEELPKLSDVQVLQLIMKGGAVFSRVAPEDKLRIVELVKKHGQVVAVTGDGINDAPALKRADIGVAMGKTGTDVAKQSSEIILLDDSFATLIGAIKQGRTIFQNIKKGTLSCFTSNAAELIVNLVSLGVTTALHVPLALSVMEILAIDLIAELFPIAALGWDKADGEVMTNKPRNLRDHILNGRSILDLMWCGVLIGGFAFLNYIYFYYRHGDNPAHVAAGSLIHYQATALTYLTIVLCQLLNILQRRSVNGLFTRYQLHNKQLWLAIALSLFCVANIIYNPWIAPYFRAGSLGFVDWLYAIGAAVIFIMIREFQRTTKHHTRKAVLDLHSQTHHVQRI